MIDNKMITLIELYNTKSYTKTSINLNITQPGVSQHIRQLEDYYKVKLIKKEGKKIDFTSEGEILLKYAKEIQKLSIGVKSVLENKTSIQKKYTIGATLTIGGYVLPRIIGEYKKKNENIDIILEVENTMEIMKRLEEGTLDLALVEGLFSKEKVRFKKFKDDELVIAISKDHRFSNRLDISIDNLKQEKLILREKGSGTREVFEQELLKNGYDLNDLNVYMEIGDIKAILSLVESNLGISIISIETLKDDFGMRNLKYIRLKEFDILREFNFVYGNKYNEEFIEDFIDFALPFI